MSTGLGWKQLCGICRSEVSSCVVTCGWHALNTSCRDVVYVQWRHNQCLLAVVNSKFCLFAYHPKLENKLKYIHFVILRYFSVFPLCL